MLARHWPIQRSSLWAGTMKEIMAESFIGQLALRVTTAGSGRKHDGGARMSLRSRSAPARADRPRSRSDIRGQPRRAASIAAMSIFFIVIIASKARLATAGSGSVYAFVRAIGVICQDNPHLSLHQPHSLSWPPLPTIAFQ